MLHNLALRSQVPFLQEDEAGDGHVAAVEPVDSDEEEAEEEDVDNRTTITQQDRKPETQYQFPKQYFRYCETIISSCRIRPIFLKPYNFDLLRERWGSSQIWEVLARSKKAKPGYCLHGSILVGSKAEPEQWQVVTPRIPVVQDFVDRLYEIHQAAQENLKQAKESYKKYADRHRRPSLDYGLEVKVWLATHNVALIGPNKFKRRFIGPNKSTKKINDVTMDLELPSIYRIHQFFFVSLLKLVKPRPKTPAQPTSVLPDEEPSLKSRLF
ncbi:hypothetical protein NDU88_002844 [Pleurodeles waltl]|uniref:Tf2-1-like SH3-like domain-containing protein n=1 Tax=Pleurodeles waltl TaxID=8319 RepID=A0AAV7QB12_PLEWA|nr:hypothetical protein NDU88_002844 [Pleurodeles waltl]